MPLIAIKAPAGVLNAEIKAALAKNLVSAAAECEQIPDDPKMRSNCIVVIEEAAAGNWTFGGRDLSDMLVSFAATVNLAKGILDDRSRARFVDLAHKAVIDSLPAEKRRITTSFIINEVEDGMWGVSGSLWDLREHAAASGYKHLQHLVACH